MFRQKRISVVLPEIIVYRLDSLTRMNRGRSDLILWFISEKGAEKEELEHCMKEGYLAN
ncbi:hypothetical protein QUF72_18220 [Desulfobacterales bacterium HSG2]|nr:hypothetical protein [Desulfobacterales bacterium HSG2]